MGSCLQLSIFSGSSCFCWLSPSFYLPLWVPMPKATVMHQLITTETSSDTATTAILYLMVTGQDTVTMAMQHPMDMSPEPDMGTTAILPMSPDMATTVTLRMSPDDVRCDVMLQIGGLVALWVRAVEGFNTF